MRVLQIYEALGTGAFGTVYKAELIGDRDMRRQVAVKVMARSHEGAELFLPRIRDEARLLGMLADDSILAVLDLLRVEGRDAVIMEWVDGIDLQNLIAAGERMPPRGLAAFGASVAGALHKAHTAVHPETRAPLQVVHRDVKPANVMLTARGHIKLLDFGIAKAAFDARESRTGRLVLGTLKTMAPEYVITGTVSPAADLYGLGLTLVEAASGQGLGKPQLSQTDFEAYREHLLAQMGWDYAPMVPILRRLLAWSPQDRPNGREAEVALLDLADGMTGTGLSRWCADAVPRAMARRARPEDREGLSGLRVVLSTSTEGISEATRAVAAPAANVDEPTRFERLPTPQPAPLPGKKRPKKPSSSSSTLKMVLAGLFLGGLAGVVVLALLVVGMLALR